jgi:two-component system response regulator AgrA
MIPVYICEDDAQQLKVLKNLVLETIKKENLDNVELAYATKYPTEILEKMNTDTVCLYLLDVDLGTDEMSGLDLAAKIRSANANAWIIMITAYNFALESYKMKLGVKDYIMKSGSMLTSIRVKECLKELHESTHSKVEEEDSRLRMGDTYSMKADEIYYICALPNEKRKVAIYTKTGYCTAQITLKELINQNNPSFFLCGRSNLININYINSIDRVNKNVVMKNGTEIPIPPRHIKTLERKLLSCL